MFCREQAARYQKEAETFEQLGVNVMAVGNGTAPMAKDFVEKFDIRYPVYTDPQRQAFSAAGMKRKLGFKFKTLGNAARALSRGHMQGGVKGDPMQQGGIVLVSTDGEILYQFAEDGPGEHLPVEDVVASVAAALAA